jgi:RNA polymerase sigma-70 factor, ECF subfamily
MNDSIKRGDVFDPPPYQTWLTVPTSGLIGTPAPNGIDRTVYDRLRSLASRYLGREAPGHPLEPTDLVHEVMLRMAAGAAPVQFQTSEHFVAVSAIVMRHVLIDYARSANLFTRCFRVPLRADLRVESMPLGERTVMREVLQRLARFEFRLFRIVILRVFEGYTFDEIALNLRISTRTAKRGWAAALARLRAELSVTMEAREPSTFSRGPGRCGFRRRKEQQLPPE